MSHLSLHFIIHISIHIDTQQSSLNQYKRHINKMVSGVNQIKKKNQSLATQDQNNTKLTDKLTEITTQLKLHAKYEQTLKNPSFKPDTEYKRSLKAVDMLSNKLSLTFTDGLESMKAVKKQREHFKTLNVRFCSEASTFLNDLFTRNSRIKEKYDIPRNKYEKQRFIGPHTPIHAILFKYDALLKYIGSLHVDKFKNITICYQQAFSKLYSHEFKAYFNWINKTIYTEQSDKRMVDFPSINLAHLIRNDDVELSQSTASTIFNNPRNGSMGSQTNNVSSMQKSYSSMPTINEDIDDETKNKITKVYRQCLSETLPVIIIEQQFMEKYFFDNKMEKYQNDIERILQSMFKDLESSFIQVIDKADSMNKFNTLEMLIISERALHSYRDYSKFLSSLLTKLHTKLTLNWNKFISQEIDWIKSQKISIKQAGILLPIEKYPAFCNEMYKVVTFGDEKSKEITDIDRLIPKDALAFIEKNIIKRDPEDDDDNDNDNDDEEKKERDLKKKASSNPFDKLMNEARQSLVDLQNNDNNEEKQENAMNNNNNNNNMIVFRESEQVTNTIHKMSTMLFHWLEKAAQSDPKYTSVCLMENYHYFYSVFSKTESLRAIREHVSKAKRNYDKARRSYVKWCVRYECKALTEFWDDFEQRVLHDIETVTVYISSSKVKAICNEYLDTDKKIKKFVKGMFDRLKKHLNNNDILFSKIWRKIAEYFCSKYKKFKENVDKIYQQNNNNKNNKYLKYSYEFIWNQFVDQYRNAFQKDFDDNSSIGSELSVGQSSMVSGMTQSSYYSSYAAKTKASVKDKQNKSKKALSTFRKKAKNKLSSNLSTRSNGSSGS